MPEPVHLLARYLKHFPHPSTRTFAGALSLMNLLLIFSFIFEDLIEPSPPNIPEETLFAITRRLPVPRNDSRQGDGQNEQDYRSNDLLWQTIGFVKA